jgi:hypothetical protein
MMKGYENCLIWILTPDATGEIMLISNAPFTETHLRPVFLCFVHRHAGSTTKYKNLICFS